MPILNNINEELWQVLDALAKILGERKTNYALIGGLGVAIRGMMRATQDIDLLIRIPQLELPGVLEALCQIGFQLETKEAIGNWNRDHLLSVFCGSVRLDLLKPVLPAYERILNRARWEQIGSRKVRVADAEGLLLLKLSAFRPRDLEDIKSILAANAGCLDLDWVRREWELMVGANDPKTEQFEQLVREYYIKPAS